MREIKPVLSNVKTKEMNTDLSAMAKKLNEEAVEVMEAATIYLSDMNFNKARELVQELLDTIQVATNILDLIAYTEDDLYMDLEVSKHNKKIYDRGWRSDKKCLKVWINSQQ